MAFRDLKVAAAARIAAVAAIRLQEAPELPIVAALPNVATPPEAISGDGAGIAAAERILDFWITQTPLLAPFLVPLGFIWVGCCWGIGSALMKRGLEHAGKLGPDRSAGKFMKAVMHLFNMLFGEGGYRFLHWKVFCPYLFDQCGSLTFMFLLGHSEMGTAVPVTNAMAIFFTFTTELFLYRVMPESRAILGALLVFLGAYFCTFR